MSEAAIAPAAPAAPTTNGTAPGATHGKGPAVTTKPSPGPGTRANNGQFLPKDGTVGAEKPVQTPAPVEAPWRFKEKLNVHGEEEEVDFDRETVKRQLQKLRALEKKQLPEYQKRDELARQLAQLAKENPTEFLRLSGQDPAAYARKTLAEEARLGAMTEEEKAIHERDQKIAAYETKDKERAAAEAEQKTKATHERLVTSLKAKVGGALKLVAPALGDNYDAVAAVADALKLQLAGGESLAGVTPEELARDALAHNHDRMRRWAGAMDGATLAKELGPKAVRALLEHSLADFDKSQTFEESPRSVEVAEREPASEYISEREVNRRMNALLRGKR